MVWRTILGTIVRPKKALAELERQQRPALPGMVALLGVSAVYTFILIAFIAKDYPPASASALALPAERQYPVQVWYQAPLFFASTALIAGLLVLAARATGTRLGFGLSFGRLALATAVPFGCTTMLVEVVVAVLVLLGLIEPSAIWNWLMGPGSWFATTYQLVGVVWLVALVFVAVRASGHRRWWAAGLVTLLLVAVYALPIGLFIR